MSVHLSGNGNAFLDAAANIVFDSAAGDVVSFGGFFKADADGRQNFLVSVGQSNSDATGLSQIRVLTTDKPQGFVQVNGTNHGLLTSGTPIIQTDWNHLFLELRSTNATSGAMEVFVSGATVGTDNTIGEWHSNPILEWMVGGLITNRFNEFDGKAAEQFVIRRALTAQERTDLLTKQAHVVIPDRDFSDSFFDQVNGPNSKGTGTGGIGNLVEVGSGATFDAADHPVAVGSEGVSKDPTNDIVKDIAVNISA